MVGVSFSNLQTGLRLGLLLVVAALPLEAGLFGNFWAAAVSDRWDLMTVQYGLLTAPNGLAALFVVAAAIWVDRCPPHGIMAAGAGVLALGGVLLTISDGLGMAVIRIFLAGSGGAFVVSLIFYAVVVNGYPRFKGALIGALGLVFSVVGG